MPEPLIPSSLASSDQPAVINNDRTVTYAGLAAASQTCADELNKAGLGRGDRVAIMGKNSAAPIILILGLWRIGAVAALLNHRLPEAAVKEQIDMIGAKRLIAESDELWPDAASNTGDPRSSINITPDDGATIVFTSGSSGTPKAVLHTFSNHLKSAQGSNTLIPVGSGDRWVLSLPLYHVGGLSILFRVLTRGGAVIVADSRASFERAITERSATHLSLVATQLTRLLDNNQHDAALKKTKAVLLGGSALPETLLKKAAERGLPLFVSYGMTEAASQIATGQYPGPVRPLPFRELKIARDGEILVRGETLFEGYVNGAAIDRPLTKDGWFATGDLGTWSGKEGLAVTGRKDNMFISGGENIYPEEIERCLSGFEDIEEAVVVPMEHREFGRRPVAFIKMRDSAAFNEAAIVSYLADRLPKYKVPDKLLSWPNRPDRESMKLDRDYFRAEAGRSVVAR